MTVISPRAFNAVIFRHGKRIAGCHVEANKQMLYLKATMGMFTRATDSKLSEQGAAEHLWSMLGQRWNLQALIGW